ncbi:MAG: hypothetical protein R6U88_06280 [Candidatus Bipolaricaulota bacterium]
MELQELLAVYQATSATAAAKERAYWGVIGMSLLASAVLLAVGAFFVSASWLEGWRRLTSAVAGLGFVLTLYWGVMQYRLGRELALWHGLLRQLEGEFAGMEFHRSAFRFRSGQEVRVPSTSLRCDEWYPELVHAGRAGRTTGQLFKVLLPGVFLVAWVLLGLFPWSCV